MQEEKNSSPGFVSSKVSRDVHRRTTYVTERTSSIIETCVLTSCVNNYVKRDGEGREEDDRRDLSSEQ
jgi:hypothetical protein